MIEVSLLDILMPKDTMSERPKYTMDGPIKPLKFGIWCFDFTSLQVSNNLASQRVQ
jgi:hypothetical protein